VNRKTSASALKLRPVRFYQLLSSILIMTMPICFFRSTIFVWKIFLTDLTHLQIKKKLFFKG